MPEIMDNQKVGALIKELLREHGMTQDDLARKLNISKSAVSQNLNGKSTFDIQNLVAIAQMFDISLERLIVQKSDPNNKEVISEYEKMVKRGIDAFQNTKINDMQISKPDIYGKVLIEYVLEYDNRDIFILLHQSKVTLVDITYHKAQAIYSRIILYTLKNKLGDIRKYLDLYVELYGSLDFIGLEQKEEIWKLLNNSEHQALILALFKEKVSRQEKNWLGMVITKRIPYLSKNQWIDCVAKYQLDQIFSFIYHEYSFINYYDIIMKIFLKNQYEAGLLWYINQISDFTTITQKLVANAQSIICEISKSKMYPVFVAAIKKGLYVDINALITFLVEENFETFFYYLLNNYSSELDYFIVAKVAIKTRNMKLCDMSFSHLNQTELNKLLGWINVIDIELIELLIKFGAQFDVDNYNDQTMKKVNAIIKVIAERKQS